MANTVLPRQRPQWCVPTVPITGGGTTQLSVNGTELLFWHVVGEPTTLTVSTDDYASLWWDGRENVKYKFDTGSLKEPGALEAWAASSQELAEAIPGLVAQQARRIAHDQAQAAEKRRIAEEKQAKDRRANLITTVKLTKPRTFTLDNGQVLETGTDAIEIVSQHYDVGPYIAIYKNGSMISQGGSVNRAGANRRIRGMVKKLVADGYKQEYLYRTPYAA